MAEAVGLALGTVALASLFTTCIECMEYFELSKNYEYDYNLACLKLSLLKSRLGTWGQTLGICVGCHAGYEEKRLHLKWHREEAVIESSLQGIVDIFGNANILEDKYRLVPRKLRKVNHGPSRIGEGPAQESGKVKRYLLPIRIRGIALIRRSTIWAIRDKQKFDILIDDLDFLISNLEAISARTEPDSRMATGNSPAQNRQAIETDTPPPTPKESSLDHRKLLEMPGAIVNVDSTTPARAEPTAQEISQQLPIGGRFISSTTPGTSHSYTQVGYSFNASVVTQSAQAFQGPLEGATFIPAPAGQNISFTAGLASGNARLQQGTMTTEQYKLWLQK